MRARRSWAAWSSCRAGAKRRPRRAHGQVIWRQPTPGLAFLGAGDDGDGDRRVVSARRRAWAACFSRCRTTGRWFEQIETEQALGVPAVVGRLAFVPWAGQYVSVIDLANGDESGARHAAERDEPRLDQGGSLWFGELGVHPLRRAHPRRLEGQGDDRQAPRARAARHPQADARPERRPLPAVANAEDKVRIYARPAADRRRRGARRRPLVRDVFPRRDGLRREQREARVGAPPFRGRHRRSGGDRAASCSATRRAR